MTFRSIDAGRFGRGLRWLLRSNLSAMVFGGAMFLLAVVFWVLPPHSVFLTVVFGMASALVLALAVLGRTRIKWLPYVVLVVAGWSVIVTGPWITVAVLQFAGHDESCQYVDSSEHQHRDKTGVTTTTTDWVVSCPDGGFTFSTDQSAQIISEDGSIAVRSAGSLFQAKPVGQATDDAVWFLALPVLAGLLAALITALRTPRGPADALPKALVNLRNAGFLQPGVTDHA